jgi:hypothetical protein
MFVEHESYLQCREVYPELEILLAQFAPIREEAFRVAGESSVSALLDLLFYARVREGWTEWPEQHYNDGGNKDWKVWEALKLWSLRSCSVWRVLLFVLTVL